MRAEKILLHTCLSFILFLGCSGCGLLPKEEVFPAEPVLQSYEAEEYEMTRVMRGDLLAERNISCNYAPAKTEQLSFSLGGEGIAAVYVSVGQAVKAGDLLAELENEGLAGQIAAQEYQIQVIRVKQNHLRQDWALAIQKQDAVIAETDEELKQIQTRRAEIDASYSQQLQELEDAAYIQQLRLEKLQSERQSHLLYAGMDGMVTYLKEVDETTRSVKDELFMTVSDMSSAVFIVRGKDAAYFTSGMEVVITANGKELNAVAAEGTELGLPVTEEGSAPIMYLKLAEPDPTLKSGDMGRAKVLLDTREDVLYVEKDAVKFTDTNQFVYMVNEDGLRVMQEVTTGLDTGYYIEILSGLKEGDHVILE